MTGGKISNIHVQNQDVKFNWERVVNHAPACPTSKLFRSEWRWIESDSEGLNNLYNLQKRKKRKKISNQVFMHPDRRSTRRRVHQSQLSDSKKLYFFFFVALVFVLFLSATHICKLLKLDCRNFVILYFFLEVPIFLFYS